jgi:hypothetical protein
VRYPDPTARARAGVAEAMVRGRRQALRLIAALATLATGADESQDEVEG